MWSMGLDRPRVVAQLQAAEMRQALGLSRARRRSGYDLFQERESRRKSTLAHQQKGGVVQSVSVGRLGGERSFVARKSFLFATHLFLQHAKVEPRVRKVRTPLDRVPIGQLRFARPSELVEN